MTVLPCQHAHLTNFKTPSTRHSTVVYAVLVRPLDSSLTPTGIKRYPAPTAKQLTSRCPVAVHGKRGRPPKVPKPEADTPTAPSPASAPTGKGGAPEDFFAEDDLLGQEDAALLDALRPGIEPDEDEELGEGEDEADEFEEYPVDEDEDEDEEFVDELEESEAAEPDVLIDEATGAPMEVVDYDTAIKRTVAPRGERAEVGWASAEELAALEAAEAAATAEEKAPEGAQLALNRQGYQAFQMDGLEFLVAETMDGKLDLQDSYIFDTGLSYYARPTVTGTLPSSPELLQIIPWVQRKSGDMLKRKEPEAKMKKVYFIGIESIVPYKVAMDQVYCFEASSRELRQEEVRVIGENIRDPVLRLRADGITIEDSGAIPTPVEISMDELFSEADNESEEEKEQRMQEKIEELEAQAEELDELDEQPDVPETDMM